MTPILAAVDIAGVVALAIGIMGVAGVIFTALRFRRDDTTAIVNQQNVILSDMKTLNEELRTTANDLRTERDALRVQVEELTRQVKKLGEANGR